MATSSPTCSARIFSSVKGNESSFMESSSLGPMDHRNAGSDRNRALPSRPFSIQPFFNPSIGIECHPLATVRPAHIADADKIGGRQSVQHADFRAEQSCPAAETHRTDAEFVGRFDDVLLELGELRIRIVVVELPQELLFGEL